MFHFIGQVIPFSSAQIPRVQSMKQAPSCCFESDAACSELLRRPSMMMSLRRPSRSGWWCHRMKRPNRRCGTHVSTAVWSCPNAHFTELTHSRRRFAAQQISSGKCFLVRLNKGVKCQVLSVDNEKAFHVSRTVLRKNECKVPGTACW